MGCVYAERLRNIALVSISRELRTITKRCRPSTASAGLTVRKGQNPKVLRQKTEQDRKALHDHVTHCRRCRKGDEQTDVPGYVL